MRKENEASAYDFASAWAKGTVLYVKWAAAHNISYPLFRVLYALNQRSHLTQKEIGEYFGLTKQTVNTMIGQLKNLDYIVLEPGKKDKREKIVSLTPNGRKYAQSLLASLIEIENKVCANIERERLIQMKETMELYNLLLEKEMDRENNDV